MKVAADARRLNQAHWENPGSNRALHKCSTRCRAMVRGVEREMIGGGQRTGSG